MSDGTQISWSDATLNVVTGCTRVSEGCDHCYIERTPPFRMSGRRFDGEGIGSSTGVMLHPERLTIPLHWRKPRRIFVCSLADLFHDDVPDEYLDEVFGAMAVAHKVHGHEFQVLTKRHARMRSYLTQTLRALPGGYLGSTRRAIAGAAFRGAANRTNAGALADEIEDGDRWPLPGVWLGVSVESQQWADIRIPALLDTPAAVRWVSAEPLLGPVDLTPWLAAMVANCGRTDDDSDGPCVLKPRHNGPCYGPGDVASDWQPVSHASLLDWVVTGGESGPGARPAHPDWFRSLRDQCQAAGVAYHLKQRGSWTWSHGPADRDRHREPDLYLHPDGRAGDEKTALEDGGAWQGMWRVDKRRAGRELDFRTHDEYPDGAR